jgi:NADPH-dependent ferric siderophore reductase
LKINNLLHRDSAMTSKWARSASIDAVVEFYIRAVIGFAA